MPARTRGFVLVLGTLALAVAGATEEVYSPQRAGFSVEVRNEVTSYRTGALFVLPEEDVNLEVRRESSESGFEAVASAGALTRQSETRFRWKAPKSRGIHRIELRRLFDGDAITFHAFVMVPFAELEGEILHGYRIGHYPAKPLRGLAIYRPPRGFVEVTRDNENLLVSPHFRLGQFVCKQEGGYPKYVVLQERLLLKLELLLEAVNANGWASQGFHVMSGYRTPFYNRAIGNVVYSRHLWGGAADIFIDEDDDGLMDDLNGDGRIDLEDAEVLYDLIDRLSDERPYRPFVGGLGHYDATAAHGPFVHIDVRGARARWGRQRR